MLSISALFREPSLFSLNCANKKRDRRRPEGLTRASTLLDTGEDVILIKRLLAT